MDWRAYEQAIFRTLRNRFPCEIIRANSSMPGRFSKVDRQIDVEGVSSLLGHLTHAVVDCKCYSKRVDVKDVEEVIGLAADVKAHLALIVTTVGYSKAAKNRAENEPNVQLHLDIVTLDEAAVQTNLPTVAVMYRGKLAAAVMAPSGWLATSNVVEGKPVLQVAALCYLHSNHSSVNAAFKGRSIAWCNIDDGGSGHDNYLSKVLEIQENQAITFDSTSVIDYWEETLPTSERRVKVRKIIYDAAGYVDISIFYEAAPGIIFWLTIIDPTDSGLILKRARYIVDNSFFTYCPSVDPDNSHEAWNQFFEFDKLGCP